MFLQPEQRQVISQRIDPKIIMANNILQLSAMELNQTIENELVDNPALETVEEFVCEGNCLDPSTCPYCMNRLAKTADPEPRLDGLDTADQEADYEPFFGYLTPDPEEDFDPVSNLEAEMTLQEHLRGLLRAAVSAEDYWIGEYIINSLTESGWLDGTPEGIAQELGVPLETVQRLLIVIQSFDPPGVGATSLQECLLIQLRYLREEGLPAEEARMVQLAEKALSQYWDHVVARRFAKIARSLGISQEEARQVFQYICTRLNPHPANQFRPSWAYRPANNKASVRPDVVIRRTEAGYEVEIVVAEPYSLAVNPHYRELYAQIKNGHGNHSEDDRKHISEYVERAELFIRNIHQRRQTLRLISRCIIECQAGFLATGSRQFLRPLTRTQVARMLNMHESTVSRATANKYVQLPNQEVIGFDIFFNHSLSVKNIIEEIIQEEDPANPLSDQQIADKLKQRGIEVARRTIVKYRESQKILSSTRRRR